jgi:3-dehydro-L-gulonate 2-dehydrogenase
LLLDLIATTLAGGKSTFDMSKYDVDYGMSQMFIAINPANFSSGEAINAITEQIIRYYKSAERIERNEIFYPGERALKTKEKFLKNGIPINKRIWEKISEL